MQNAIGHEAQGTAGDIRLPPPRHQGTWLRFRGVLMTYALIVLGLLPIWTVRYVPLYDYQNHLLEAQVVVRYHDPALAYAPDYQIREGWYLRSNALTTLLMVALGQVIAVDLAGKIVLSLYIVMLTCGVAMLLNYLGRPAWLLLMAPVLLYNLTFTAGLLNWSYGFALILFAWLCYLHWQRTGAWWAIVALAWLALLIYVAHVLAWGLCLITICTIAVTDNLPPRRYLRLLVALSSAVPLLAITRPLLALAPAAIAAALWCSAVLIRRLRLRPRTIMFLAAGATFLYLIGVKASEELRRVILPSVGYSVYDKLVAAPRLFTLPHHSMPVQWGLVIYNLVLLALLSAIAAALALSTIAYYRAHPVEHWRWFATLGVLTLCYMIVPSRTQDILVTEPRILLLASVIGLLAVRLPPAGSRLHHALISLCLGLAILASSMTYLYAGQYDSAARQWSRVLAQIPPARRVLVLAEPLLLPAEGRYDLMRAAQVFDPRQFTTTYALEHGGFVSITFFNGPLLPLHPQAIPAHWWSEFNPATFVAQRCDLLHTTYEYVVVWNLRSTPLIQALRDCDGEPIQQEGQITVWRYLSQGE